MTTTKENAQKALSKMRRGLSAWMASRDKSDAAMRGEILSSLSLTATQQIISSRRRYDLEDKMAIELRALLAEVYDTNQVRLDKLEAYDLAKIVVTGALPSQSEPQAQGVVPLVLLIVAGGLVWIVTYTISTYAQNLREEEDRAKCAAGVKEYCPTQWWKLGAVAGGIYFLWNQTALFDAIKKYVK